jgi:hypothetical protein
MPQIADHGFDVTAFGGIVIDDQNMSYHCAFRKEAAGGRQALRVRRDSPQS